MIYLMQIQKLQEIFGDTIEEVLMPGQHPTDVPIVFVRREKILDVLRHLKNEPDFEYDFLSDITAIDENPQQSENRFEVVYNLYSMKSHERIRLKVRVNDGESVPSAVDVWPGANWAEREVFDMFGIPFSEHPDLRRILNDERFEGHPLRKDYYIRKYQYFTDAQPIDPDLLE